MILQPTILKNGNKVIIKEAVGKGGIVIVKTDWCGYCKRAIPELFKVAQMMGSMYPVFKIDADQDKKTAKLLKVEGYPTIFFIDRNGVIGERYNGERESSAILQNICDKVKICRF